MYLIRYFEEQIFCANDSPIFSFFNIIILSQIYHYYNFLTNFKAKIIFYTLEGSRAEQIKNS